MRMTCFPPEIFRLAGYEKIRSSDFRTFINAILRPQYTNTTYMTELPIESLSGPVSTLLLKAVEATPRSNRPVVTIFDGPTRRIPSISLAAYIERIETHSGATRANIIAALAYVDRVITTNDWFTLTESNVHRLLWTCVVAACKFYEDKFYSNEYYAKVGGISLQEMNKLEAIMLDMVHYELFITPQTFAEYDQAVAVACGDPRLAFSTFAYHLFLIASLLLFTATYHYVTKAQFVRAGQRRTKAAAAAAAVR